MLIEETDKLYGIDETNNKTWGDSQADGEKHGQKSRTATTKTEVKGEVKGEVKENQKTPHPPSSNAHETYHGYGFKCNCINKY
jgi:hypothetical protein